ncbi:uncharacterized protein PAC_08603 [Phialocephala subalpina]|uniref:Uncharacterized protein n=1 Tax=Phialocephala subalpina TaxID=576137 RepID=A0A1L7X120_9HELO|nr:uncharacterized protein PAC_08603 [Phialocephala subalpina]
MRFATFIFPAYLALAVIAAPAPTPVNLDSTADIPCPGLTCYNYLKSIISIIPRDPQVTREAYVDIAKSTVLGMELGVIVRNQLLSSGGLGVGWIRFEVAFEM